IVSRDDAKHEHVKRRVGQEECGGRRPTSTVPRTGESRPGPHSRGAAPISNHAGELASVHALRGADAVHLASLVAVGAADTLFAVWDQKLRTGAEAAGVRLAPMA